jgi:hypothetical protein
MSGPYFAFGGAAWIYRPNIQVLSTVLPFHFHPSDTRMQRTIARHLGALKKTIQSLEDYYKNELPRINDRGNDSPPQAHFPYIVSFMPTEGYAPQSFTYKSQPDESKLLFIGELGTNKQGKSKRICIKFTQQYCEEVHVFCASKGFAPALHGVNRLAGGWYMVVMDAIDKDYEQFTRKHYPAIDEIRASLITLHQAGYVHGDVRDTNVMVQKNGSDVIQLVDFDWAGKIGEVKYPVNVNRTDVVRPEGALDGRFIFQTMICSCLITL